MRYATFAVLVLAGCRIFGPDIPEMHALEIGYYTYEASVTFPADSAEHREGDSAGHREYEGLVTITAATEETLSVDFDVEFLGASPSERVIWNVDAYRVVVIAEAPYPHFQHRIWRDGDRIACTLSARERGALNRVAGSCSLTYAGAFPGNRSR